MRINQWWTFMWLITLLMPPNVCSRSHCRNNGVTIHELPDDLLSQLPAIPLPNTDPLRSHSLFLRFAVKLLNLRSVNWPLWQTRSNFSSTLLSISYSYREGKQQKDELTYIKKPPNAFMLFLEEQRPFVTPELRRQGTSKVNKALGKRVSFIYVQLLHLNLFLLLLCGWIEGINVFWKTSSIQKKKKNPREGGYVFWRFRL